MQFQRWGHLGRGPLTFRSAAEAEHLRTKRARIEAETRPAAKIGRDEADPRKPELDERHATVCVSSRR